MDLELKLEVLQAIVNVGVVLVTTPFVLFFMLKDGHKFKRVFNEDYAT